MLSVALLVGGKGTRLGNLTSNKPKCLLDIHHQPFIWRQIETLINGGVDHIVICTGFKGDMIRQYVGDSSQWGIKIDYSDDGETPLGTCGALVKALPLLSNKFIVAYGDTICHTDYVKLFHSFETAPESSMFCIYKNRNKRGKSTVIYHEGKVYYNKVDYSPLMEYIDYGLTGLSKETILGLGPGDLTGIMQFLLMLGRIKIFEIPEEDFYLDIGSEEGLEETRKYYENIS